MLARLGLLLSLGTALPAQTWSWATRGMSFDSNDAFAADLVRERSVAFGRFGTWELAGDTWLFRPTSRAPSSRHGHALAWHPSSREMVLFGGREFSSSAPYLNDTWTFDGTDWTQRSVGVAPSARRLAAMAPDLLRDRVVLFSGTRDNGPLGDTWQWDGQRWQQMTPRNRPPDGKLAPDLPRQRVALLATGAGSSCEHWEWDGVEWSRLPVPATPPAGFGFAFGADFARGRLVCWIVPTGTLTAQAWEWDGTTWSQRQPTVQPTSWRGGTFVYDPGRARLLLLGGSLASTPPSPRAWIWDGVDWRAGPATPSPTPMQHISAAVDWPRQRVVAFAYDLVSQSSKTFELEGGVWREQPGPGPLGYGEIAFDPIQLETLLFGGSSQVFVDSNDTWSWNGGSWRLLQPANRPSVRREPTLVADPVRGRIVLFGGLDMTTTFAPLQDTWTWDGFDWTRVLPANAPSPRMGAAATHDDARGEVVLFGGEGRSGLQPFGLADTWVWDGVTWRGRQPTTSPPAGSRHGLAFEPGRQRVVLFGGIEHHASGPAYWITEHDTIWEWDGGNWARAPGNSPPGRARGVYDGRFGRIVKAALPPAYFGPGVAMQTRIGTSCGGRDGPLQLAATSSELGARLQFDVLHAPAGAPGMLVLSLGRQNTPLGAGCTLLVEEPLSRFWLTANHGGFATVAQAVPLRPNLAGVQVLAQAFALDPSAPLAFGASDGVLLTLGY